MKNNEKYVNTFTVTVCNDLVQFPLVPSLSFMYIQCDVIDVIGVLIFTSRRSDRRWYHP